MRLRGPVAMAEGETRDWAAARGSLRLRLPRNTRKGVGMLSEKDAQRLRAVAILAPASVVWLASLPLALAICIVACARGLYVEYAY